MVKWFFRLDMNNFDNCKIVQRHPNFIVAVYKPISSSPVRAFVAADRRSLVRIDGLLVKYYKSHYVYPGSSSNPGAVRHLIPILDETRLKLVSNYRRYRTSSDSVATSSIFPLSFEKIL